MARNATCSVSRRLSLLEVVNFSGATLLFLPAVLRAEPDVGGIPIPALDFNDCRTDVGSGRIGSTDFQSCAETDDAINRDAAPETTEDAPKAEFEQVAYFGAPMLQDLQHILTFVTGIGFAKVMEVAATRRNCQLFERTTQREKFNIYHYVF
eukprot:TRINITY_DN25823_c0_g1_i1.p1 TRINITY_DN25823_c0_g1~~TRINITY_DN25823_c0_g1_i1.p1  ORF type:complete len:152 (-),score=26.36 TRINITY_DN25823_c0_g1_i1:293-748(-)